jgi:chromate transporter
MPPEDADLQTLERPASPRELYRAFMHLALQGFGGVLPVAQRELVERRRWLTRAGFLELLSTGQVLPGPNIVNLAIIYGDRQFGWRGALAALAGLLLAPLAIVLVLAALYAHFVDVPAVVGALRGMGAVAAGLVISTGVKMAPTLRRNPLGTPATLGAGVATFVAIVWLHVPLVWVVLGIGGASIACAAWHLRAAP